MLQATAALVGYFFLCRHFSFISAIIAPIYSHFTGGVHYYQSTIVVSYRAPTVQILIFSDKVNAEAFPIYFWPDKTII